MTFGDMLTLAPELLPLAPRIQKAIATGQRLEADPDVKDMLAVIGEVAQIVAKSGVKS